MIGLGETIDFHEGANTEDGGGSNGDNFLHNNNNNNNNINNINNDNNDNDDNNGLSGGIHKSNKSLLVGDLASLLVCTFLVILLGSKVSSLARLLTPFSGESTNTRTNRSGEAVAG